MTAEPDRRCGEGGLGGLDLGQEFVERVAQNIDMGV
jgi:hypothetical protein